MALEYARSNVRLTRELEQVAKEATRVAETLRGINLMPQSFPVEAMGEICISLSNLTNGTAEGCVEPLNFARHMLPLVRRDHFYIEGEQPEPEGEEDTYFAREHPLDHAITRLYVAVGTALDEYRSQAQDTYDDQVGAEDTIEFPQDGTFAEIGRASQELANKAEQEIQSLSDLAEPNSANAENLKRQIQDSANLSHSVQSQIRIRPIIARWYKTASAAMSKLPDILIKTANQMRFGVDIAQIWVEEWDAFQKRLRYLAYEQIGGLADALEATGERLKRGAGRSQTAVERQRDPAIIDAERRVRDMLLAGAEIPPDLAERVEILLFGEAPGRIQRPADLLALKNMHRLALSDFLIEPQQIGALRRLSNLTSLSVTASDAHDLSALGLLSNLTSLSVTANNVGDLSPLGQLSNLTSLSVTANKASDLSPLGKLSNLTSLSLQANNVNDLLPLGTLSNLTYLSVQANNVSDLSPLGRLAKLTSLSVNANKASDISPLSKLSNLTSLSVMAKKVGNLSPLGMLSNLTRLSVHAGNVRDLLPVGKLSNLTSLTMQSNNVSDLSPLGHLSNLTNLSVQTNNISNLSPLGMLLNLTRLSVHAGNASDLSPLGTLSNLISLSVIANKASDLSPMAQLTNLTSLSMHVATVDLTCVNRLRNLTHIKIADAQEVDLGPLALALNLRKLSLSNVTYRNSASLAQVEIELTGDSREV